MPPGFLGNNTAPAIISVTSDESSTHTPGANEEHQSTALNNALAKVVVAVRKAVLKAKEPGAALHSLLGSDQVCA